MYDVNYFIKKFSAIPDEKWATEEFYGNNGSFCALGHCGVTGMVDDLHKEIDRYPEAKALYNMANEKEHNIMCINDASDIDFQQETPKERVLAFLESVKEETEPEVEKIKERIVYVAVPETIREMEVILS